MTAFNINTQKALAKERDFLAVPSEEIIKLSSNIDRFTPIIIENQQTIKDLARGEDEGLLKKPEVTETILSPRSYTVEKGDTISTIAEKFGLTVATLLEANNLKGSDTTNIHIGQNIIIPPENTSTSLAWLDEEQKVRQEREQKARAAAQAKISATNARRVAVRGSTREVTDGGFAGSTSSGFIVPMRYRQISRCGLRSHPAADLAVDVGTPVVAAADGKVVQITGGWGSGYGNSVEIDHGGKIKTLYAHLSKISVGIGYGISQGQILGYSGNTGFSTGPHLHFAKYVNGREVPNCP